MMESVIDDGDGRDEAHHLTAELRMIVTSYASTSVRRWLSDTMMTVSRRVMAATAASRRRRQ